MPNKSRDNSLCVCAMSISICEHYVNERNAVYVLCMQTDLSKCNQIETVLKIGFNENCNWIVQLVAESKAKKLLFPLAIESKHANV